MSSLGMRHEAAYERRASVWDDLGLGVAVFVLAAAFVVGIGLWTHYVTGAFLIVGTAILAWHSGFRPALICALLSTAAMPSLINTLDAQANVINMPVRVISIGAVSIVVFPGVPVMLKMLNPGAECSVRFSMSGKLILIGIRFAGAGTV